MPAPPRSEALADGGGNSYEEEFASSVIKGADGATGRPRDAAWESKWQAMEADLLEAVNDGPIAGRPAVAGFTAEEARRPVPGSQVEEAAAPSLAALHDFVGRGDLQQLRTPRGHRARGTPREASRHLSRGAATPPEAPAKPPDEYEDEGEHQQSLDPCDEGSDSDSEADGSASEVPGNQAMQLDVAAEKAEIEQESEVEEPCSDVAPDALGEEFESYELNVDDLLAGKAAQCLTSVEEECEERDDELSKPDECRVEGADAGKMTAKEADLRAEQRAARSLRCMWRLWFLLLALSFCEALLIVAGLQVDIWSSPCRRPLLTCHSLHIDDCSGDSCQDFAPIWALCWPACGLLFLVVPLWAVLRAAAAAPGSTPPVRDVVAPVSSIAGGSRRAILLVLLAALATVGCGAMTIAELSMAGLHYAARCPIERSGARCGAQLCPEPMCRRESEFSPCMCGRLAEEEMARGLFLNDLPACQPYEWYSWQMDKLEQLVLRYESFACIQGPLACAATAVGALLLLAQLACCPLLLLGRLGVRRALLVLLATDEELERALLNEEEAVDKEAASLPVRGVIREAVVAAAVHEDTEAERREEFNLSDDRRGLAPLPSFGCRQQDARQQQRTCTAGGQVAARPWGDGGRRSRQH